MSLYLERFLKLDTRLSTQLRVADRPGRLRQAAALFAHSGDSWFCLLALGLVAVLGDPFWRTRALIMIAAIFIGAVLVLGIKFSVRRKRPLGEWGLVYRKTDPHSFPSGHATRAFMLATIAVGSGLVWFGLLLMFWAPLVALSRVAMGVHFLSDILAGAVLGILLGVITLWLSAGLLV